YDVVVTAPAGGSTVDAIPGSGATSQTRISASDIQIVLTNAQTSTSNQFLVGTNHAAPTTLNISPNSKTAGDPAFTLTVNGTNCVSCAVVRVDGSNRPTTFINSTQLPASIPATDVAGGGPPTITVFTPPPGGGFSNGQTLPARGSAAVPPP